MYHRLILISGLVLIFLLFNFTQYKPDVFNQSTKIQQETQINSPQVLLIPKLNLWVPIIEVSSSSEAAIQAGLINGVVHYPDTATAGEVGNTYIMGHSSNYAWVVSSYNQVFARLPELQPGDNIFIVDQFGQKTFVVNATLVVEPTDTTVMSQATNGKRLLSLQTSYPIGTANKRLVIVAELVQR